MRPLRRPIELFCQRGERYAARIWNVGAFTFSDGVRDRTASVGSIGRLANGCRAKRVRAPGGANWTRDAHYRAERQRVDH